MMGDFKLEVENRSKGFIVFFPDLQGLQVISSSLNIQNMNIMSNLTLLLPGGGGCSFFYITQKYWSEAVKVVPKYSYPSF